MWRARLKDRRALGEEQGLHVDLLDGLRTVHQANALVELLADCLELDDPQGRTGKTVDAFPRHFDPL
jgi:hypothetical protein